MMLLNLLDKVLNKTRLIYVNAVFSSKVKYLPKGERPLLGEIVLANPNVTIGKNVKIYPGVWFWGDGDIVLEDSCEIGTNTMIYASKGGGVFIGQGSQIAAQCYIIDMDHGMDKDIPILKQENSVEKIIIGDDVWLGANVTVLKGSRIESGAVVGAKSLVKGRVDKGQVVAGVPAKHIRYRM